MTKERGKEQRDGRTKTLAPFLYNIQERRIFLFKICCTAILKQYDKTASLPMLRALRMRKGLNFGKWFVIWQKVLKTAIIKESWKCVFPKWVETARIQRLQHIKTFKKRLFSLQKKKKQLNSGAFFQMLCFSPDLERVSKVTVATGYYRLRYWNFYD